MRAPMARFHVSLGQRPRNSDGQKSSALKARFNRREPSPKRIAHRINAMPSKQITVFPLKCARPVVLFLRIDIFLEQQPTIFV